MHPAMKQRDLIASNDDVDPMKKATASVTEVIVIEGPACLIPYFIRSLGLRSSDV